MISGLVGCFHNRHYRTGNRQTNEDFYQSIKQRGDFNDIYEAEGLKHWNFLLVSFNLDDQSLEIFEKMQNEKLVKEQVIRRQERESGVEAKRAAQRAAESREFVRLYLS